MAKHVTGWGRVHLVERLAKTEDAEIKEWLLREGFRNSVMYEYLAYIAATTGGLNDALHQLIQDPLDREVAKHGVRKLAQHI